MLAPYSRTAELTFTSREGARLGVRLQAELRLTTDGAQRLLDAGQGSSALDRLHDAVDRVVSEALATAPTTSSIPELDGPAGSAVELALSSFGRLDGPLVLEYAEESPVFQAIREAEGRRALRGALRETGTRILIVGLDGADWQMIDPLVERGLLPNLESLRRRGAWGNLKSLKPILSPLLWTSVCIGAP